MLMLSGVVPLFGFVNKILKTRLNTIIVELIGCGTLADEVK